MPRNDSRMGSRSSPVSPRILPSQKRGDSPKNPRLIAILLSTLLSAIPLAAQTTPSTALLVLSKRDQTLAIVDPVSLLVVATVPSGPDPHEVVASTDGKAAFISNYGGGEYNTISVVDLVAQKPLARIDLGALHGPHGLAFAGGKVYFTAEINKVIGRYDPATQKIDWVLGTGQNRTHMIAVSSSLDHIFTSNVNSGTISIIESRPGGGVRTDSDWDETVVDTGRGTEGFDISPDGKELWSAEAQKGTISVIDLATKKRVQTFEANIKGANRLKFTTDGKLVFVSSLSGGGGLAVFDAASRREVKRVNVGHGAAGILMQPDGTRAYVACSPDNYVVVIDLKTLEITGHIDAGHQPDGLAWATRP
jgi:YVTN family beta-propeller protein